MSFMYLSYHSIGKKEPALIHIVKSTNKLGFERLNQIGTSSRLKSVRDKNGAFSPLRSDKHHENLDHFENKRLSSGAHKQYDDSYFKNTTKKERLRDMHQMRAEVEQAKREEIIKIREINRLMKSMGKEEHENNIRLFQKYNEEEKTIINSLIKKNKEKEINNKISRRLNIIRASRKKDLVKSEMNFALNFSRQKNLIQKYEQAGEKSKRVRNERIQQLSKVRTLRSYKSDKPKVQLSSQLFDTSFDDANSLKAFSKELPSLNPNATMDTYRTEALSNSIIKHLSSREPVHRNTNVEKSYHSYRIPSHDAKHFSIKNSTMADEDGRSSHQSLQSRMPKYVSENTRSMSGIKFANGRSVDHSIFNPKGMFALPSIRNNDAIQLLNNYHTPNKTSLL